MVSFSTEYKKIKNTNNLYRYSEYNKSKKSYINLYFYTLANTEYNIYHTLHLLKMRNIGSWLICDICMTLDTLLVAWFLKFILFIGNLNNVIIFS